MRILRSSLIVGASLAFVVASASGALPPNPLTEPWKGPYGGVPAFDQVKVKDFPAAVKAGMAERRATWAKIANDPSAPTIENTIVPLEKEDALMRTLRVFSTWSSSESGAEFKKIEGEISADVAALDQELVQNEKIFKRIEALYDSRDQEVGGAKLTAEQRRLIERRYEDFERQGARLTGPARERSAAIAKELAALQAEFGQKVLGDEEEQSLIVEKESELAGLPDSAKTSAAAAAERAGQKGKWSFANTRSAIEPILTYAKDRGLRERAFRLWTSRGENDNKNNTSRTIARILELRQERAKLLGFPTYAHWRLAGHTMAKTPDAAMKLMLDVWKPAVAAVKAEVAEMQKIVDAEGGVFAIAPWDYRYYEEKARLAKHDFDANLLKPYLRLPKVRDAMFWSAGKLYGLKFKLKKGIPTFDPAMEVYEATDASGKTVGLWYFDPYARAGKRSGAWMSDYRLQSRENGKPELPLVSNNSNFIPGRKGEPTLLTWEEANTMFHEFGHALHGLLSNVRYASLAGTNTAGDFVEFPSQVNEIFLQSPETLKLLTDAKGRSLPKELQEKLSRSKKFGQGFAVTEYLASAIVDMKLHLATEKVDPAAFEKKTLKEIGMPAEIVMRHRTPQFNHIFAGDEYSAGYYGYLWAQVLGADASAAFKEAGSLYDPTVAKKMRDQILSVGDSVDPGEAYRRFRGRDATIAAYLEEKGFKP